jgi:hypothetical protein
MLKKIWQSFMRWFRKLFGRGASKSSNRFAPTAELPPLDDTDREYLFMQLLEGVAHGWQQPRAIGFFNKIRQRVRKSEWLEWLDRFGNNLLEAPVPNYELAGRMVQLGQLDCGEIGDLAGDYGARLLDRQAEEFPNLLPIMEFSDAADGDFGDVPLELLLDNNPFPSQPPRSFTQQPEPEQIGSETQEITLEEFSAMLHKDPGLVAELATQLGVETTDPQVIINAVVAQMQQQVQQVSGDLNEIATEPSAMETPLTPSPEIPTTTPPEIPTPPTTPPTTTPEIPVEPPVTPTPNPTPTPEIPENPPATPAPNPTPTPEIPPNAPPVTPPPEIPVNPPVTPAPSPTPAPEIPTTTPPEIPTTPPEIPSPSPTPPEMPPMPPVTATPASSEHQVVPPPPPPPAPKLEYKSEDPWNNTPTANTEQPLSETANTPDRHGV